MKRFFTPLFCIAAALCADLSFAADKPVVYASNYPLAYFAERIAGDAVEVRFPAEGKGDPSFWKPGNDDIAAMQRGDLILLNGATYEKWRKRTTLPPSKLVDTSKAFSKNFIKTKRVVHSHGPGKSHSHGGTAGTTWMDLTQAKQQAEKVRDALTKLLPEKKAAFETAFDSLAADIDALHQEFLKAGKNIGDKPLVVSHPVYQYFSRCYDLNVKSVHWEPTEDPGSKGKADLAKILKKHDAKWMIWEGKPIEDSVKLLADKGIASIVIDPCGNRPDEGDWMSVMRANVEQLQSIQAGE